MQISLKKQFWELHKLREAIEREVNWKPAKIPALQKVTSMLHGIEKPKKETLDRLSLFVGFQDWEGFQKAIHGETGAEENYSMKNIGEKQKPDFQENKNGSFPED